MKIEFNYIDVDKYKEKLEKTLEAVYEELMKITSATRYTEEDLRRLRPYSRRNPRTLSPEVHKRTGALQAAIKTEMGEFTARIILETDKVPHLEYVWKGTRRMIPRPFVEEAIKRAEPKIREIWGD